jgi:uncharacterized protein YukE
MKKFLKSALPTFFTCVIGILIVINSQSIIDRYRAWRFTPNAEISEIASTLQLTTSGRRLFYASNPTVQQRDDFRTSCIDSEQTIVLGCYVHNKEIYILDVTETKLQGIEEVTAAHELLHAVYARMSSGERENIDSMVMEYYRTSTDPRLSKTVAAYQAKDGSVIPNELHSILGSEYADLPSALESHYSKYFSNRLSIVRMSHKYEKTFTDLETQIATYDEQLKDLELQIEDEKQHVETTSVSLGEERAKLESIRDTTSAQVFNESVALFNKKVAQYNKDVDALNTNVDSYNAIVAQRNSISLEKSHLVEAIDTRTIPAKQ